MIKYLPGGIIGGLALAGLALFTGKTLGLIDWPWGLITAPLWIGAPAIVLLLLVVGHWWK